MLQCYTWYVGNSFQRGGVILSVGCVMLRVLEGVLSCVLGVLFCVLNGVCYLECWVWYSACYRVCVISSAILVR